MMPQPVPGAASNPQAQPPLQQYPQQQPMAAGAPPPQHHQQWMMMMQQQQQQQQQQQAAQPVPPPAGWTPQPVPPPVPAQMQQYPAGSYATAEIKSLWIGDLQPHMDENYLVNCFAHTGEVLSAKVIRNKQSGLPEGYGFIEFVTHAAAERILQTYNGSLMPNSDQNFRMNWATLGPGEKRHDDGQDYTIFVGDLAADVTDYVLQETFKAVYSSVKGAKVVTDRMTGRSKGYGFVKFSDEAEQVRAMNEMNGRYCSSRPMRIGPAANKKTGLGQSYQNAPEQNGSGAHGENDPNNTTIFVGALDPSVTDDLLRQVFSQFGELQSVKIPAGKRCGFVHFVNRASAEQALQALNGTLLGGQSIRLSWGRSPSNRQTQGSEQSQWNSGLYGYSQGYEGYGYAPQQDTNMYYGGYPGYNYQQQPATYQQQPQQ